MHENYDKIITYNAFTEYLLATIKEKQLLDSQLRECIQIDPRTWTKKKQDPTRFTISELISIANFLNTDKSKLFDLASL